METVIGSIMVSSPPITDQMFEGGKCWGSFVIFGVWGDFCNCSPYPPCLVNQSLVSDLRGSFYGGRINGDTGRLT